jgi:hypothetical protein
MARYEGSLEYPHRKSRCTVRHHPWSVAPRRPGICSVIIYLWREGSASKSEFACTRIARN